MKSQQVKQSGELREKKRERERDQWINREKERQSIGQIWKWCGSEMAV